MTGSGGAQGATRCASSRQAGLGKGSRTAESEQLESAFLFFPAAGGRAGGAGSQGSAAGAVSGRPWQAGVPIGPVAFRSGAAREPQAGSPGLRVRCQWGRALLQVVPARLPTRRERLSPPALPRRHKESKRQHWRSTFPWGCRWRAASRGFPPAAHWLLTCPRLPSQDLNPGRWVPESRPSPPGCTARAKVLTFPLFQAVSCLLRAWCACPLTSGL